MLHKLNTLIWDTHVLTLFSNSYAVQFLALLMLMCKGLLIHVPRHRLIRPTTHQPFNPFLFVFLSHGIDPWSWHC
jgi:hypothetical protein